MFGSGLTERVIVLITIDTECDHDPRWVRSKPLSFRSVLEGIPERLQPLLKEVGAVPTYLLAVEVMEDTQCVQALTRLEGRHELGTHLHAAFVEPQRKYLDYGGVNSPDFQCHCPPEIEFNKLENLTTLFRDRFGYGPKTFRAGRFGAGAHTVRSLERLGYTVDTSVTPCMRWSHPAGDVDFRAAPDQPYFPAYHDLARDGGRARRVLEIPVTIRKRWLKGARWFRPWFSSLTDMKAVALETLRRHREHRTVVLNMMFHSMEVTPGATPYPQNEPDVRRFLDDIHAVLCWCQQEGFEFAAAADAAASFRRAPALAAAAA